jgi:hypothetical protein
MQIEVAKTVAAQPIDAFMIVASVVDWPQIIGSIIGSIKSIEVLTPGPVRAGTRLREPRIMFGRNGPRELVRAALQGAASVAGLLITTEAMVAEAPKKESPALPTGGMGGMGGIDY